jgi:hypothetical protein
MKPRIYKHEQSKRWVSDTFIICHKTRDFVTRLDRKDTGYKDCHSHTIRHGIENYNVKVTHDWWGDDKLLRHWLIVDRGLTKTR